MKKLRIKHEWFWAKEKNEIIKGYLALSDFLAIVGGVCLLVVLADFKTLTHKVLIFFMSLLIILNIFIRINYNKWSKEVRNEKN